MTTVNSHAEPDAPPADLTIPADLLEQWTGRTFTADEAERLRAALTDSSVPDTVGTIAHAVFNSELEWTADPDGEPGDLTADSQRVHDDNTSALYTLSRTSDGTWNLCHTQFHDDDEASTTYLGHHDSPDDGKTRAQLFEAS